jgi:hypothetical protein
MPVAIGRFIGREVCEALGLDPALVLEITIQIRSGEVVDSTAEMHVTEDQMRAVVDVLRRYHLEQINDDADRS